MELHVFGLVPDVLQYEIFSNVADTCRCIIILEEAGHDVGRPNDLGTNVAT